MSTKFTYEQVAGIHLEAVTAARRAEADFIKQHGEMAYCGFAWVNIPEGRSSFATNLKKITEGGRQVARKSWQKGIDVWNPGGNCTQSMDVKEAGANAYARVLEQHGVRCYSLSRAD